VIIREIFALLQEPIKELLSRSQQMIFIKVRQKKAPLISSKRFKINSLRSLKLSRKDQAWEFMTIEQLGWPQDSIKTEEKF